MRGPAGGRWRRCCSRLGPTAPAAAPIPGSRSAMRPSRSLRCRAVAATPAVRVLEKARVAHTLHPYDPEHPSDQGYGEAAVAALGADPRQVFKTLVARVDGVLTVAVVPVERHPGPQGAGRGRRRPQGRDGRARPTPSGRRATCAAASARSARRRHCRPSSTSPRWSSPTVMVSAGKRGLQVELPPADLVRLTRARTAPDRPLNPRPTGAVGGQSEPAAREEALGRQRRDVAAGRAPPGRGPGCRPGRSTTRRGRCGPAARPRWRRRRARVPVAGVKPATEASPPFTYSRTSWLTASATPAT